MNVCSISDNAGYESYGTSPSFPVPDSLVEEIIETDLSRVINRIFGEDKERSNKGEEYSYLLMGWFRELI